MRVMFISNLYPPNQIGGYEQLCCEVATHFAAAGHEVSILTSTYGRKIAVEPGQIIHQSLRLIAGDTIYEPFNGSQARRETLLQQNNRALADAIARDCPNVIFCWNLYGLGANLISEFGKLDLPVVLMLTDNWLAQIINPDFVSRYFREVVHGAVTNKEFLATKNDAVSLPKNISAIFGAEYMRQFYAAAGISVKNSEVVHNGVKLDRLGHKKRIALNDTKEVKLLFAGRVVKEKGVHVAVRALNELVLRAPEIDWRLDILGDMQNEQYSQDLSAMSESLGIRDRIAFFEPVPAKELPAVFNSHDIYLFPSLYEPFSLTLIHALASGIPTVASDVGGNPEIVVEGETGLLYPKDDASILAERVIELARAPERAKQLGIAGRKAAQAFGSDRMLASMIAHLEARICETPSA